MRGPTLGWWCAAVFAAGCTCGRSTAECSEPSLWYSPDPAGGVFWGCKPPEGWLAEPPGGMDTARLAAAARAVQEPGVIVPPERGDAHDTSVVATGTTASTGWTGSTADTGALLADTDAAGAPAPPADTATLAPGNTAAPLDTAALVETGLPVDTVAADTAAVVPVDTAAPADAAQPEVDPGGGAP